MAKYPILIPLVAAAVTITAGLGVTLADSNTPDARYGPPMTLAAGSSGQEATDMPSEREPTADADANVSTEPSTGEDGKANCHASAKSHARATVRRDGKTIVREQEAHDSGPACSAHSSAKARVGGGDQEDSDN